MLSGVSISDPSRHPRLDSTDQRIELMWEYRAPGAGRCEGLLHDLPDGGDYNAPAAGGRGHCRAARLYLGDLTAEGFRGLGTHQT
jgi:hypothetical protein